MPAKKDLPFKCPACAEPFRTVVGLRFHVRNEHPGRDTPDQRRTFNRLESSERAKARAEAETKIHPALLTLYRYGCPCRLTYKQHIERAAELGRTP